MSVILPLELQMLVCYPLYIINSTNDLQESVVKKRQVYLLKRAKICFFYLELRHTSRKSQDKTLTVHKMLASEQV